MYMNPFSNWVVTPKDRDEVAAASHKVTMFNVHTDATRYEIFTFPLDAVKAAMGADVDEFARRRKVISVQAPGGQPIRSTMQLGIGKGVSLVLPPGSRDALAKRYVTEGHFCHLELVGRLTEPSPTLRIVGVPAVADPEQREYIIDMSKPELMFKPVAPAQMNSTDERELTELGVTNISAVAHVGPNATCQRNKVRIWETTRSFAGLSSTERVDLVMRDKDRGCWSKFEATVDLSGTKSFTLDSGATADGQRPILMEERLDRAGGKWGNVGEWRSAEMPVIDSPARVGPNNRKRAFVYTAYGPPVLTKEQSQFLWEAMIALPSAR